MKSGAVSFELTSLFARPRLRECHACQHDGAARNKPWRDWFAKDEISRHHRNNREKVKERAHGCARQMPRAALARRALYFVNLNHTRQRLYRVDALEVDALHEFGDEL